jgi:hypothetical protein
MYKLANNFDDFFKHELKLEKLTIKLKKINKEKTNLSISLIKNNSPWYRKHAFKNP